ncbi:symmetrical bis(5'-nucleosyl)-tetraphosphatase [Candidatus Ichthyocystis sparus]|uniref:symmetrical bis(5'-nucleosyl)-tetraphosphatase n=1 Tax=Candidatus Ichthyocystis sparus TaxID=1561004 RepID=UPI000B32ED11|nr:symmetrical bis(5'-nucleosyl)-tetraphosphatase [Candidatus Ichthyocystis sparus]
MCASSRTFVVGDIHGCYSSLMSLLELVGFNPQVDYLWCVGDLVNRGPDSLNVLKTLINWGDHVLSVLGNHDLYALALLCGAADKYDHNLVDLLSYSRKSDLVDWLRARPIAFMDKNYFLVHAGISPLWDVNEAKLYATDLSEVILGPGFVDFLRHFYENGNLCVKWTENMQDDDRRAFYLNILLRVRFLSTSYSELRLDVEDDPIRPPSNCIPWFKGLSPSKLGGRKVIFGHWSRLGWSQGDNYLCIDTGCVWGNQLTMVELPLMQRWSLHSRDGCYS